MAAFHLFIEGRVQGVGYRAALADMAQSLGLGGWVRNRRDGRVEAQIQGPADRCDALIAWAHNGPPAAQVTRVHAEPIAAVPSCIDFQIRATA